MKKAKISVIKAKLSQYIRFVKAGEEVIILDRDQPVAKIVGISSSARLSIREPVIDLRAVLASFKGRTFKESNDILDVLLLDREDRF